MSEKIPDKDPDIKKKVIKAVESNNIIYTFHGRFRMEERNITAGDIKYALLNSTRNPDRDEYKKEKKSWSYTFEGPFESNPKLALRVGVGYGKSNAIIVTLYNINKKKVGK